MYEHPRTPNLHKRPLAEMKPGETLYARRVIGGMAHVFYGELVEIKRSVAIHGRWISPEEHVRDKSLHTERFRTDNCFLWGHANDSGTWSRCHHFSRGKNYPAS